MVGHSSIIVLSITRELKRIQVFIGNDSFTMMGTSRASFWDLRTEFATVCVPKQKGSVSEVSDWSESSLARKKCWDWVETGT